jgi:hypothetical protein
MLRVRMGVSVLAAVASASDTAHVLSGLEAPGPLPVRTLVVPGGRYVHAVRKALLERGRTDVLAGLDAITAVELSTRALEMAGVSFERGEEEARVLRIDRRLASGEVPAGFEREAILRARGWGEAFARVVGELEGAGLRPEDLRAHEDARVRGIAALWASLDEEAAHRWTRARILVEAVAHVAGLCDGPDPIAAVVTADTPAGELRLLAAIPGIRLVVHPARPLDEMARTRFETVLGAEAAAALGSPPEVAGATALARLQRSSRAIGEGGDLEASSGELDVSLALEQHEGVEREIDAAARWVAEQVEHGVPLEEIAVLTAERDPYPELLSERIRAVGVPVHVAGGLPFTAIGGTRLLRILRALKDRLSAAAMLGILPLLRLAPLEGDAPARSFLSRRDAFAIAYGLGTAGGHPVAPQRARDWPRRARAVMPRLAAALAQPMPEGRAQHARDEQTRQLERLRRLLPALDSLDAVMAAISGEQSLGEIVASFETLAKEHVGGAQQATNLFLSVVREARVPSHLRGVLALDHLIDVAGRLRVPTCRFGTPAVFVGGLGQALGLRFRAVRVVGLAEGTVPPRVRPDVILGEEARRTLGLPRGPERASASRRRYAAAIASATQRLVLSCPRVTLDRATRTPSTVLSDAVAAVTGATDPLAGMRDAFRLSRERAEEARLARPIRTSERFERMAATLRHPAAWEVGAPTGILAAEAGTKHEVVGPLPRWEHPPGLHPEAPISASRLKALLECPYRFFVGQGLYWQEPVGRPEPSRMSPLTFGNAIHRCAELFFEQHGQRFESRVGTLEDHLALAEAVVEQVWAELRERHVLENDEAWTTELVRAHEHMHAFVEHEWSRRKGRWIAAERPFGYGPAPVRVDTPTGPLWLHGDIDRLRAEAGDDGEEVVEIWDLKTGKCAGPIKQPDHGIDLQVGLYVLVARAMQGEWGLPETMAAGYVYTDHTKGPERYYGAERVDELAGATRRWLGVARELLEAGLFPRTPDAADCTFCHLRRACGPAATLHSARSLRKATGPLRSFATLKGLEVEQEGPS